MKALSSPTTVRLLKALLVAASAFYILLYVALALVRMRYPFTLEWMEGGMLDHVRRALAGQPIYVGPTLDFVPFIYTPLYYYVAALFAKVMGAGFPPLRLVSFLSSLGSFWLIYLFVVRETKDRFSGFVAAGLFAATYRVSGAWFDIARLDSLFVFLLLTSLYVARFAQSLWGLFLAGVVAALAFLAKQVALVAILPVLLTELGLHRRKGLVYAGTVALLVAGSTLVLNWVYGGWYAYYVFYIPQRHGYDWEWLSWFWFRYLIGPFFTASILSLGYLVWQWWGASRDRAIFYTAGLAGALGASVISRLHPGGWDNALIPLHAFVAIVFGLMLSSLIAWFRTALAEKRSFFECCLFIVCLIQFGFLMYSPGRQLPSRIDLEDGWRLVETIRGIRGEVFVPCHSYLAEMAGKKGYAHSAAITDLERGDSSPVSTRLHLELVEAIREKKFAAILYDFDRWGWPIGRYYGDPELLLLRMSEFKPVTGLKFGPRWIYYAKPDDSAGHPARQR